MIELHVTTVRAPAGLVWIAGTTLGVTRVGFGSLPSFTLPPTLERQGILAVRRHPGPLQSAVRSLRDYFEGRVASPSASVVLTHLSPFARRALDAVRHIAPGQMATYDEVAQAAGSPRGARAVGKVLAANPVPLFIPCHRVVTKEGRLAGYQGRRAWKQYLLELESSQIRMATPRRRTRRDRRTSG